MVVKPGTMAIARFIGGMVRSLGGYPIEIREQPLTRDAIYLRSNLPNERLARRVAEAGVGLGATLPLVAPVPDSSGEWQVNLLVRNTESVPAILTARGELRAGSLAIEGGTD